MAVSMHTRTKDSLKGFPEMDSQILGFMCFMLIQSAIFYRIGHARQMDAFVFLHIEIAGLLMLRNKIKERKNVQGISGMTMIMYALVFGMRAIVPLIYLIEGVPGPNGAFPCECFVGIFSFLLVLDVLKAIFVSYKETYQSDLDTLKAWYLIPVCLVLGLTFSVYTGTNISHIWFINVFLDVVALMPQLFMMSLGAGKIEVPIANFVAALFMSHAGEVVHTLIFDRDLFYIVPSVFILSMCAQTAHVLLYADFMWYYCKAKSTASAYAKEIELMVV